VEPFISSRCYTATTHIYSVQTRFNFDIFHTGTLDDYPVKNSKGIHDTMIHARLDACEMQKIIYEGA